VGTIRHEERKHARKTMQIGLRRVGAGLDRWDGVKAAHVGEERGCQKRRPGVGRDVVRDRMAQPDEGSSSFFVSAAEAGAGVKAPESLRNA
jgi:hypothetical protein